jgi:hypothetical protein
MASVPRQRRPPLDPAALSLRPGDLLAATLEMSPAMALLRVSYPVVGMQRRLRTGQVLPDVRSERRENLVIYREGGRRVANAAVSDAVLELLGLLCEGTPLVEACGRAAARVAISEGELVANGAEWFADFARHGWVVGVKAA